MKRTGITLLALVLVSLGNAQAAHAATTLVAGVSITTPAESLAARAGREPRSRPRLSPNASPTRGTLLSVGATVIPIAAGAALIGADIDRNVLGTSLLIGGLVVGPSIGYLDAGLLGRGAGGIALRAAGASLAFSAVVSAFEESDDFVDAGPIYLFLGGCAVTTGLAIYDCVAVHGDIAKAQRATMSIGPARVGGAPGVGVSVRF